MTYEGAQKGWDGAAMTILMLSAWAFSWLLWGQANGTALAWASGLVITTKSFQLGGRTQMIGAIQSFNGGKDTTWMDAILAPCPRRQAFLSRLEGLGRNSDTEIRRASGSTQDDLSNFDEDWVTLQAELAKEAADVMRRELQREEKRRYDHQLEPLDQWSNLKSRSPMDQAGEGSVITHAKESKRKPTSKKAWVSKKKHR